MSYLMVFLLMVTMPEFLKILKFLLTLIPQPLIQKVFQNQALLIEMLTLVLYHQIVLHWRKLLNILKFQKKLLLYVSANQLMQDVE